MSFVVWSMAAMISIAACMTPWPLQNRLKALPDSTPADTKAYLQKRFDNCVTAGKHFRCNEVEMNRLLDMFDITEPKRTGPPVPRGVKPDQGIDKSDPSYTSLMRERKAAQKLSEMGYDVQYGSNENIFTPEVVALRAKAEKNYGISRSADVDLYVEGKPFQVYAPMARTTESDIVRTLSEKSQTQTGRIVMYSDSNGQLMNEGFRKHLKERLRETPDPKLREVLVIHEGKLERIFP